MVKIISDNSVQLCGRPGQCCPIINKLPDGDYEVLDDYGNKIKVKKEELDLVADAVKTLNSKPAPTVTEQLICG